MDNRPMETMQTLMIDATCDECGAQLVQRAEPEVNWYPSEVHCSGCGVETVVSDD